MCRKYTCLGPVLLLFFVFCRPLLYAEALPGTTGLLELAPEEQARILEDFALWEAPATRTALPERVVNSAHLPLVGSQGTLGICGSYVVYYYLYSYYYAKSRGLSQRPNTEDNPEYIFSPAWGVLIAPHGHNKSAYSELYEPWGANSLQSIKSIIRHGALTWKEMPYSDAGMVGGEIFYCQLPSVEQMRSALRHKGLGGIQLSAIDTPGGLQALKAFLHQGNIAVATWNAPLTLNFDSYPAPGESVTLPNGETINSVNNEVYAWPSTNAGRPDAHAVTIVGYDDTIKYRNKLGEQCQGALLIVNSWGSGWGISPGVGLESGFMWLGYEALLQYKKLASQAYAITVREQDYEPLLLGRVSLQDLSEGLNWQASIAGHPVNWPGTLNCSANGQPLDIDFPVNLYVTKSNTAFTNIVDYIQDFSSMAQSRFPSLIFEMPYIAETQPLGKLCGLEIIRRLPQEDGSFQEYSAALPNIDFSVQRYSSSYPSFSAEINILQERSLGLEDIYPQNGSAAWGDANGDGFPDLAVSSRQKDSGDNIVYLHRLYLNDKQGGLLPPIELPLPADSGAAELLWLDIDNDGDLDLVAGSDKGIHILKNNGQAHFTLAQTLPYSCGPGMLCSADFDLDGRPDLAVAGSEKTLVLFQTTAGNFSAYTLSERYNDITYSLGNFAPAIAAGDINGDSWPDLVASGRKGSEKRLLWYKNNGDYTFSPQLLPLPAAHNFSIAIADYDGDGCDDILYSGGSQDGALGSKQRFYGIMQGRGEGQPKNIAMPSGLPPLWGGRVLWADLDNDGRAEAIIGGIENQGITLGWSYGSTEQFPAKPLYRHYTRVLHWDEGSGSFLDSGMQLPSTLGFMGASMLCAVDFDNDGDLDLLSGGLITSKAGFVAGRGPGAELCKMFFLENLACGYFGQQRPNAAPAAPSALSAEALGQGKVRFNWSAPADDLTSAGALRYLLQLGTASGVYNLCSGNVAYGNAAMLLKPGLSIRRLPAGKLYWRVRAVDTSGKLSPWSGEASVDASGSEAIPSPGEPLPEQDLPLIQINAKALDSQGAESGGYVQLAGSSIQAGTGIAYVLATARPGWRFSHWEGPVDSPLARKTSVRAFEDSVVTARFVPDHELLYTAATHSAMRDRQGNVWAWSDSFLLPAATGPEWLQSEDGMPALAAASSPELRWLSLNDQQTWCGFSVGYDNAALDDPRNFPLDSLVQSHALDSSKWWTYNYAETSLALWCGGSNSMVAYFMNPSGVQSDYISFKGALMAVHPYDRWPTSATVNPGFVQAACTDSYALLLSQQGETWGIGANQCGQLGDGSQNPIDSFTPISGIPRFKALATNQAALEDQVAFSLGLDFQGRVWSWGNNRFGQLGQGTYENNDILEAQMLPPFPSPVIAIACGYRHALALCENGQVYAWGDNRQGQVGMGDGDGDGQLDQEIVAAPYALPGLDNVICIAAAARHSLALTEDEQLYGWGDNESGQINARTSAAMWTPTLVENAPKWQSDNGSLSIMLRSAADQPGSAVPYSGLGTVTPPPADYAARVGARLQVRAQDGERYRFLRWEGPVDEPDNPETWVNIGEGANSLCAVFELFAEELSLHIQSSPPEAGSTLPEAGLYSLAKNSSATLTALPRLNYVFEAWQSVSELGENARQAQFDWTFNSDLSLSAVFSPRQFRCQPKPNPDGGDYSLTSDGRLAHRVTAGSSTRLEFPEQFSEIKLLDLVGDSLALGNDGRLYAWGGNNYGELGNGASKSTYTALKDYNLVLDPDGQGHFSGAVKVYAGKNTRFAQKADGSLYIWGRMPYEELPQSRPRRVFGLKENARVIAVAEAGEMAAYAFIFLYDDGTLASWGAAEFSGTGVAHKQPAPIPGLSNVQAIAAGSGVVLALSQDGRVYVWGKSWEQNYSGALGLGANKSAQATPTLLNGLSGIKRIFVVERSCFAVDSAGKLRIWGYNGGSWFMGVGSSEPEAYFVPTLHPLAGELPEFLSIYGGGAQVLALSSTGELWRWGRNAFGYDPKQSHLLSWPEAVQDISFPGFDPSPLIQHRLQLLCDPRAEYLLSYPSGVYTLMHGDQVIIHAGSSNELQFRHWRKDGEIVSEQAFLQFTLEQDCGIEAVYEIGAAQLELGGAAAAAGATAALPLYLTSAPSSYEAFDLQVSFPDQLRFRGLDWAGSQMQPEAEFAYWPLAGETRSPGLTTLRITLQNPEVEFIAGETPLAWLLFELPWGLKEDYAVSIGLSDSSPALSRQCGAYSDLANACSTLIETESSRQPVQFQPGWMYYTAAETISAAELPGWLESLYAQGIDVSALWSWDTEQGRWLQSRELKAGQPLLLYVERGGSAGLPFAELSSEISLKPGWNLLSLPKETPVPEEARVIFKIGKDSFELHSQGQLQPGQVYWLFRDF